MKDTEFVVGELVRLKSGGPIMTYSGSSEMTGSAICVWFEGSQKREETFDPRVLEKTTKPSATRTVRM